MLLIRTSVTVTVRPCMQLESHLLLRRMSVLLQRFNSILFHETFSVQGNSDGLAIPAQQFLFLVLTHRIFTTGGDKKLIIITRYITV